MPVSIIPSSRLSIVGGSLNPGNEPELTVFQPLCRFNLHHSTASINAVSFATVFDLKSPKHDFDGDYFFWFRGTAPSNSFYYILLFILIRKKSNKSALLQKYIESNEKKYFLKITNQNLLQIKTLQVFQPKLQLIFINSNKCKPAL